MAIMVKTIKGRKYVYEQYRHNGRVVTRYIGPLDEMVRIYELYKAGPARQEPSTLLRSAARQGG